MTTKDRFTIRCKQVGFIVALLVVAAPFEFVRAAACPLTPHKPYKASAGPGVFYILPTCKKRYFESSAIYFTYFDSWKAVVKVPQSQLNKIPYDSKRAMENKTLIDIVLSKKPSNVWATGINEKILPEFGKRRLQPVNLSGAKNEFVSFQIAVVGPASKVSVVSPTFTSGPNVITPAHTKLFREELITLTEKSGLDGFTGRVPDALIPDVDDVVGEKRNAFPFDIAQGETRAVWVDVHIPENAPAGLYGGVFTVQTSLRIVKVPVMIKVLNFTIPSTASLKSYFGLSYGALTNGYGIRYGESLSQLRARFVQLGLDHRISLSYLDDGNQNFDHLVQAFGSFLDGSAPTQLKGAKLTTLRRITPDKKAFVEFTKDHGWFDRIFEYSCDEPPDLCRYVDIPIINSSVKAADPRFRNLVTMNIKEATEQHLLNSVNIIVPIINEMDNKPGQPFTGNQRNSYNTFLASNPLNEIWLYQSCMSHGCDNSGSSILTGWPSYSIDAAPLRARDMAWMIFKYRASGELYYDTGEAMINGDAWTDQRRYGGNGDGTLFYPGKVSKIGGHTDIPISSIRLKLIRAGYQDYEYLHLLEKLGGNARAHADKLFPNPWTTPSTEAFNKARAEIAAEITAKLK